MPKHRGHNEGSIYQRKDGRWTAVVTVGRDATGKIRRRQIYGATRADVANQLTKILSDAQQGLPLDVSRQTVGEFLTRWMEDAVKGTVRPNTLESYGYTLKHILPAIGRVKLAKLTPHHLVRLYRQKQEEGLTRTVVLIHALLHKALGQATKWGLVPRNVAALVEPPKVLTKEFQALSPEGVAAFLAAADEDRFHALYVLAITAGLRQGELLGLRWGDIDLEGAVLTVRRQLQWLKGDYETQQPVFSEPKTAKARRTVALSAMAVAALRRHRKQQSEERLALGGAWHDDTGLVFTTAVGSPVNPSNLRNRSFGPIMARAGLSGVRFHDLRHTTATLLLGQGIHPKLVQEQLGHSRISVTLDTYSHVSQPMMREAAAAMDAVIGKASEGHRS